MFILRRANSAKTNFNASLNVQILSQKILAICVLLALSRSFVSFVAATEKPFKKATNTFRAAKRITFSHLRVFLFSPKVGVFFARCFASRCNSREFSCFAAAHKLKSRVYFWFALNANFKMLSIIERRKPAEKEANSRAVAALLVVCWLFLQIAVSLPNTKHNRQEIRAKNKAICDVCLSFVRFLFARQLRKSVVFATKNSY